MDNLDPDDNDIERMLKYEKLRGDLTNSGCEFKLGMEFSDEWSY